MPAKCDQFISGVLQISDRSKKIKNYHLFSII